nr:flocculation protein FLO11-like [Pelodiscus sinensis]|eukprot:XP_006126180.1 flocculation protein FLO11-like [Pelodiscus sinensis]
MPVDSTTVLLSNTVLPTDTSESILATDTIVVASATSTIPVRDSTTTPSAVSFTPESVSTTPPSREISTTESSHISSTDTSRATPTTFTGTIDSTTVPESNSVLATDTSEPSPSTDGETEATSLSTVNSPDITKTPAAVSDTETSSSPSASSSAISATASSDTSSADTSRVTPITSTVTMPVHSTTVLMSNRVPTAFFTTSVKLPVSATILTSPDTFTSTTRSTAVIIGSTIYPILTSTATAPSPGACPSLDFSLRLEKVTSDVIQFSWTPLDGRKESPYTASLSEDNREVNKSTTDKTNIEFKGLLPGQKYTISVEVLICGQKASTSMTVQTASKNFKGQTRLTNQVFKPQYSNKSSAAFKDFEKNFTAEIKEKMTDDFKTLFNKGRLLIVIDSISNGSVIVLFNIMMAVEQNLTETNISSAFIKALNESTLWKVDFQSTSVVVANSCETGLNDCSKNAVCTPKEATYSCECKAGFKDHSPSVPGKDCQDINECTNSSACSDLASCNNTEGSYECTCNPGIKDENPENPGKQCKDPVLCFNSTKFCSTQNNDCLNSKNWICSSNQAFACKISFKDKVFVPEYYNSESQIYQNLSQKITTDVVKQMRIILKDDSFDIVVVGFRNGSVIAYFVSLLQGQQSIDKITFQKHLSEIVKTVFAGETEVIVEPIPTSSEVNLTWRNAVIVLGVLFGVAFILALLILSAYLWMRCTSGQYWIEPKGLLGNFAYKYL